MKLRSFFLVTGLILSLGACQNTKKPTSGNGNFGASGSSAGLKSVYFDFDKALIRDDQASVIQSNADAIKSNSSWRVTLEGNCDERGTNEYNIALGDKRARVIHDYLVNLGVDPARLNVMSFGEEKPVCSEHDESCWWQNRRADFRR